MEALPRLPCLLDTPEVDDTPFVHPVGFRMGPCKCPLCDPAGTAPVTFYEGSPMLISWNPLPRSRVNGLPSFGCGSWKGA